MSRKIDISNLSDQDLQQISTDLQIAQEVSKYAFNKAPNYICLYEVEENDVYVPFSYSQKFPRPKRNDFPIQNIDFHGKLRDAQVEVKNEAIDHLNKYGSTIISSYCGFGKTLLGIYIATKIKMKTLIICHRIVLINQWKESIQKFCPNATIQILSGKSEMKDVDFYIINATNIPKHPRSFYKEIGCAIVDELHIIMAEKMSQCMRYIVPRYTLGLSATPYRMDGLDVMIDMYFGKRKIIRKLWRKHTVYKINTGIKPTVKLNKMGKVDWGSVIESQCNNKDRNEMIIRLIQFFSDRVFLVLCKRVEQANYLVQRLLEEKEDVTSLIGSNQTYEQKSRILVGTCQKCGVGFDHPRLNTLILASDLESYFEQFSGRAFRTQENEPIIFDIVDSYGLLEKHFKTRNAIYLEQGGIVKDFIKSFPNFKLL
jgi:superfamily II DNA or RNA helicase